MPWDETDLTIIEHLRHATPDDPGLWDRIVRLAFSGEGHDEMRHMAFCWHMRASTLAIWDRVAGATDADRDAVVAEDPDVRHQYAIEQVLRNNRELLALVPELTPEQQECWMCCVQTMAGVILTGKAPRPAYIEPPDLDTFDLPFELTTTR